MLRFTTTARPTPMQINTLDMSKAKRVVESYLKDEISGRATIFKNIDGKQTPVAQRKLFAHEWKWIDL